VKRPSLNQSLSAAEFMRWYWLKEELYEFCRVHELPRSGSKPDLTQQIVAYLSGLDPPTVRRVVRTGAMPIAFTLKTIIGVGWRCNPSLGRFFREQCGVGFRFNAAIRDFIHSRAGCSLEEAVSCYRASVAKGAPKQEIIASNEYNRHTREFYERNPKAKREEVLAAWWKKRNAKKKSVPLAKTGSICRN
jgi:SAP domain-containing new25/Domain of unknown function (DUF6434)